MADQYLTGRRERLSAHGWAALLLTGAALLGSCRRSVEGDASGADRPDVVAVKPAPRPGVGFNPATVRVGQRVAELVVDSVAVGPTPIDSILVGTIRFRGPVALTGTTVRHFDADAADTTPCFEADAVSAASLPRWLGDERRPWFCFDNPDEATRLLGLVDSGSVVTFVINRFTIHRGFSEQVNSATLVSRAPSGSM